MTRQLSQAYFTHEKAQKAAKEAVCEIRNELTECEVTVDRLREELQEAKNAQNALQSVITAKQEQLTMAENLKESMEQANEDLRAQLKKADDTMKDLEQRISGHSELAQQSQLLLKAQVIHVYFSSLSEYCFQQRSNM